MFKNTYIYHSRHRFKIFFVLAFFTYAGVDAKPQLSSSINVRVYGAKGNGISDDYAAIQKALDRANEHSSIFFPRGTYIISKQLNIHKNNLSIEGPAKIVAKAGESFEFMLLGNGVKWVIVKDIEFDANKNDRVQKQMVRYMGAAFIRSVNCKFLRCKARNTLGYGGVSAVGLTIAGQSVSGTVEGCLVINCGNNGLDSDGIFTSGTRNTISNCTAINCTDAAFVIESSNYSSILNCKSINCSAGAGITNATVDDKYGNVIKGLTIVNWCGSNTGGIQIGMPGKFSGNLFHSKIHGVSLFADKLVGYGYGPAILIRHDGLGKPIDVLIDSVSIDGSYNQGIVINGDEVMVTNTKIKNVVDACIQFQKDSHKGVVSKCILNNGSFGVVTQGGADVLVEKTTIKKQAGYGLFAFDKSSITSTNNFLDSSYRRSYAKEPSAVISIINK